MLIVTRKRGERIYIADDTFITVLSRNGQYISLEIDAPKSTSVNLLPPISGSGKL